MSDFWRWGTVVIAAAAAGYILGSINFAIIISLLFFREDVRGKGSGNAGMTNILRNYGKIGAMLTLLGDIGKGILAVWFGSWVMVLLLPALIEPIYGGYIGGIFAIIGHMFPIFFQFKGGKGVAVSGGVILALQPLIAGVLIIVFLLVVLLARMVSLGSIIAMLLYPFAVFFWAQLNARPLIFCSLCALIVSGMVVIMHKDNIRRILSGSEYRFGSKGKG